MLKINDNFRKLIEKNGGVDAVAGICGLKRETIRVYYERITDPRKVSVMLIAKIFGVDWKTLVM
jgi:hypothetical protein